MLFKAIDIPSPKEAFIKEIQGMVLTGQLIAGDRLPTERELSIQMNIPRSVVNAGLADLERMGFVSVIPRRGTVICDYMRCGRLETLDAIMNFTRGRLDRRTFESIMDFRLLCEPYAARLAALNRTDEDLRDLEDLCKKTETSKDISEALEYRQKFNKAVYFATGNTLLPLIYNGFDVINQYFAEIIFDAMGSEMAGIGMRELFEAIRDQDAEKAYHCKFSTDETIINVLRDNYFRENGV